MGLRGYQSKPPNLPPNSRWKIVSRAGITSSRNAKYLVECSCPDKTRKIITGSELKKRNLSCGCLRKEKNKKERKWPILPSNSRWRILSEVGKYRNTKMTAYLAECSCPNKTRKIIAGGSLRKGSLSCGCLRNELSSIRNKKLPVLPVNSRFTIINELKNCKYLVECSCGNKKILGSNALSTHTLSCGCYAREINRKFPILPKDSKWKIIEATSIRDNNKITYLVECSCKFKTRKIVRGVGLTNGSSKSCGRCTKNKNSLVFSKLFEEFGHLSDLNKTLNEISNLKQD